MTTDALALGISLHRQIADASVLKSTQINSLKAAVPGVDDGTLSELIKILSEYHDKVISDLQEKIDSLSGDYTTPKA